MGVAAHLGIRLAEYDRRIRTFIPDYEEMLDVAAAAVPARARLLVDVGIGTGALSARCLKIAPRARSVGLAGDETAGGLFPRGRIRPARLRIRVDATLRLPRRSAVAARILRGSQRSSLGPLVSFHSAEPP